MIIVHRPPCSDFATSGYLRKSGSLHLEKNIAVLFTFRFRLHFILIFLKARSQNFNRTKRQLSNDL